jgi:hypothetical protein
MPQYYSIPNWEKRGKVKIIPRPFWRRIPILKQLAPYRVGDKIRFLVQIDQPFKPNEYYSHVIYERFSGDWKQLIDINKTDTEVIGHRINSEGNIEYCIGYTVYHDQTETVFTTTVNSWDTITDKWFLLIGGAIIGWLLSSGINLLWGLFK